MKVLLIALLGGVAACHDKTTGSDDDVDRIVQAVAERKQVTVTLHIATRPGDAAHDQRVQVVGVEFDANGALKTVHFTEHGRSDTIPGAGFRKVLVHTAPITIN